MCKILNNETPSYLNAILDRYNQHKTEYTLRHQKLRYPVKRTVSFNQSAEGAGGLGIIRGKK